MGGQSHTAGPWEVEEKRTGMTHVRGADGSAVCYLRSRHGPGRRQFLGNASLIEAAPELLGVAASAYAYGVEGEYDIYLVVMGVEIVRAAINSPVGIALQRFEAKRSAVLAKATGEGAV